MLMIDKEKRHDIRYHVQQYFIPEMVECVKDGYLPFIALFPSAQWLSNLRMDYELEDLKAAKVWDSFEKIPVDEDTMTYRFVSAEFPDITETIYTYGYDAKSGSAVRIDFPENGGHTTVTVTVTEKEMTFSPAVTVFRDAETWKKR